MELSFSELREKEVVNTKDGRKLGRICDVALCYPDNRWVGVVVPDGRSGFKKNSLFIDLKNIVRIGEDVVLVNVGLPQKPNRNKRGRGAPVCVENAQNCVGIENRNFEEYE